MKKKSFFAKFIFGTLLLGIIAAGIGGIALYKIAFETNVEIDNNYSYFLKIPTGATFENVKLILAENNLLKHQNTFEWVAKFMKYDEKVKAGRYLIKSGMKNKELVLLLRSGRQTPLDVVINSVRTKEQLAGKVGVHLESDSLSLISWLNDTANFSHYGFNKNTIVAMIIPNTYEFFWNTSPEKFYGRMKKEYDSFWSPERKRSASDIGLKPIEVSTLASIVEQETNKNDEKNIIAGVYLNRLKKGWKLEADPTLVYAANDFGIKRVLKKHKEIESPYNTYKHVGLPPGPICIPSIASLDAVLNYEKHNYMYFCAKEDFSGYHNFASSYVQHLLNARKFQKELNKRKIK